MVAYVGTSGWSYDHWEGVLYPPGTPARDRLDHYARALRHGRGQQQLLPLAARTRRSPAGTGACPPGSG